MEKEIILRSNSRMHTDPCEGCIFLAKNIKKGLPYCNIPTDFNYKKYGNCGEKSSCVYMYKTSNKVKVGRGGRKKGAVTTKEQLERDAGTKEYIDILMDGSNTVKGIAIELGCEKIVVYNRIFSYARRHNIIVDIKKRSITKKDKNEVDKSKVG